jgi:hypothetical protein
MLNPFCLRGSLKKGCGVVLIRFVAGKGGVPIYSPPCRDEHEVGRILGSESLNNLY